MRYKRTYILINFCLDDEDLVEQRVTRKRQKIHSDTDNSGIDCKQNIKGGYTTIFSALSSYTFILYCDSNIGLFSLASYKAIALPTIATAIVVALTHSERR